tara:strand:+ start:294 stop:824 length:531 start_codon:yes stop_codon:yes gene_type:complete
MAVATPFDQPIPGQSLTGEPGNNPWEQPAMMSDLTEITKYYIEKLANQEIIDDFATLCESGLPLKPIVETITTNGTMKGMHSVDAAILVGPVIHQFLKQAIMAQGVEVDDDGIDYQKEAEAKEMDKFILLTMRYLEENPEEGDPGKELLSELVEEQPPEEAAPEEGPKGLMAKGQM